MRALWTFCRQEPVLVTAALAALVSCCFVPPDREYLHYFDLRTLALLYALMLVVAGLREAGAFDWLARAACTRARTLRAMALWLVGLCFVSSMLITNDVALLTFVPFAAVLCGMTGQRRALLPIAVLQTAAANLGSMLTPVGNPQNLYLYSRYGFTAGEFFRITLPVWLLSGLLLALLCCLLPRTPLDPEGSSGSPPERRGLTVFLLLFAVCLLAVFRVIGWPLMLGIVAVVTLVFRRKLLLAPDFLLLLTFCAFFVFAGNLARLPAVDALLRSLLTGREYLTGLLASQVISNVPAALLLSGFTENGRALLLGVDVGGLGTPIASLASLIGMKLYARTEGAETGRFLLVFAAVNAGLLLLLTLAVRLLYQSPPVL